MDKEKLRALYSPNIRGIVEAVNVEDIKKEDIVSILKDGDQYVLIYYK